MSLKEMKISKLYETRDRMLRIKDCASRIAFDYNEEIERRKEQGGV